MANNDLELIEKLKIKFPQFGSNRPINIDSDISFGEIIHDGKLSWLATGAHLEVFSLKDGQRICSYHFDGQAKFEKAIITSITEIECANENCCFLAVGLQISDIIKSIIAIYSVQGSKILRCIEIPERITCCVHISEDITKRIFLQLMQGCLAIGTDIGKLVLLDINFKKCETALLEEGDDKVDTVPCHMVKSTLDFTHISNHYKHTLQENFNFGIELEQVRGESFVLSLLPVAPALCLIAGLEDGRMIIYDLTELQILYIVLPQEHLSPLSKMTFLQPQDDPRAMIYIWAFHENPESCFAVMHCLEYEKKVIDDNEQIILFEEFQTSHVKLVLTMNEKDSLPIRCQAITKFSSKEDDSDAISICMLAWKTKNFTQLLIFDMNQWYKEEMPEGGDWREHLTYLSPFRVKNLFTFDVYFDKNTVSHFNSVQRIEEYFYPISLTFDFVFLLSNASIFLHWPGLQYKALDTLNMAGPLAISDPGSYYNEIKCAYLIPQFYDMEKRKKKEISLSTQREILLSVALEYNCIGLLKNCARSWADGSCIGQKPNEGVSLSTLTDWIWKRASDIKQRCNSICVCLFDYSGRLMDQRSKKELFHLTRQLKILADLLEIILINCKQHIPGYIYERLNGELNSIRTASEYHDVLQWLLNIGLLPEGIPESSSESTSALNPFLVPYPYKLMKNYYKAKRLNFLGINHHFIQPRTNGCRLLYIDSFIEHKCNIEALKEHWEIELGQAAYPPPTMQALLRTLLVPNVPLETKHALLIYTFLDLNMAVTEESYAGMVQNLIKFPAVFKLNASLIKIVQAFWNLDHGQFEVALEEIVCPFLHEKKLEQWEQELLIESLLVQEKPSFALRALQARSAPVNSILELKVYVANNLISEAFHLTRSKNEPELLQTFVRCCEYIGKWNILRDLALTEEEEKVVEDLLKDFKSSKPENIYLMHMLQKSKYIEAKTFLEEMKFGNNVRANSIVSNGSDLELSKTLLSAYNCTMTPFSKNLNECYYNIRNKVGFSSELKDINKGKFLKPFSAELLKENKKGLRDGLFQSSILSIDGASNYWNEKSAAKNREERMMQTNNVPFVRKPQLEAYIENFSNSDLLTYPETFREPKKRRLSSEDSSTPNGIINENPIQESLRKRIRLTEIEDYGVLSENDRNKFLSENFYKNESDMNLRDSKDLLKTPVVKSCKFTTERSGYIEDKILTPHSILKIKSSVKTISSSPSKPVTISNAKPIQYQYIDSENVSEVTENENDMDNIEAVDDTFVTCKTSKLETINLEANEINSVEGQNNNLSKLETDSSKVVQGEISPLNSITAYSIRPKGRKTIRISNINNTPASESRFFTPISSQSPRFSSSKDINFNTKLIDFSFLNKPTSNDPETVVSTFQDNLYKSLSHIARPSLRRSETPPKRNENIKIFSKRIVHSEEMSDSDMLCRKNFSENSQKSMEFRSPTISTLPTHPPLSRLVTERNLLKNFSFTKDKNLNNSKEKSDTRCLNFKEITEYSSELYKTNTNEFNPLTCSSKVTNTVSKFTENSKKVRISDQTTVCDDISDNQMSMKSNFDDNLILPHKKEETKTDKHLMTTIEATNYSLVDTTGNVSKAPDKFNYKIKTFLEKNTADEDQDQYKSTEKGIKKFEAMESEDEEVDKIDNECKLNNQVKGRESNVDGDDNQHTFKIDEKDKKYGEKAEQEKKVYNELLPKYDRPSYHNSSNVQNSLQSHYVDIVDISSESDNKSENPKEELISYDLMEKILRNATSKNFKKYQKKDLQLHENACMQIIEKNYTLNEKEEIIKRTTELEGSSKTSSIASEASSRNSISENSQVSLSLNSTLDISTENEDISKNDQIDENACIQINEENNTSREKEEKIGYYSESGNSNNSFSTESKTSPSVHFSDSRSSNNSFSTEYKTSPSILFSECQETSKESSKSSVDNRTENSKEEHISYDLMEKILRNATSRNVKNVLEAKQMNEVSEEPSSDKPISVSSSLDSTLEISNEDEDVSKDCLIDKNVRMQISEEIQNFRGKEENTSKNKNNVEKTEQSSNLSQNQALDSIEQILMKEEKEENKKISQENTSNYVQRSIEFCENHRVQGETLIECNIRNIRARSEETNKFKNTNNLEKIDCYENEHTIQETSTNTTAGKRNKRARSTEHVFPTSSSHWLRSSTIPRPTHLEDEIKITVDNSKEVPPQVVNSSIRAQSVDRDIFRCGYFTNSPRPKTKRAVSEQPTDNSNSKLQNINEIITPNTIMTRRRSRLLDRIDEETFAETPKKKSNLRKRHDSEEYKSESSFALNIESEKSELRSPIKESKHSSLPINFEESSNKGLPSNITRAVLRGTSIERDGTELIDNDKNQTPTRFSRRLSLDRSTDITASKKETYDSPIKKRRGNSVLSESSEATSTPRATRASSSLREVILTPRRSSRGASLAKELPLPIQEENIENKKEKTPLKRSLRRLSHNENTPNKLLHDDQAENISGSLGSQNDFTEADLSIDRNLNETEAYSMQRRLTRTQKSLLEKSANIKAIDQSTIPLKKRQSRMDLDETFETEAPLKNDDTVSIKSNRSKKSGTSVRHSSRLSLKAKDGQSRDDEDDNEDRESTVSSIRSTTSNRSPRKKKLGKTKLNVISEKDEDIQKNLSDVESNSTVHSGPNLRNRTKKMN